MTTTSAAYVGASYALVAFHRPLTTRLSGLYSLVAVRLASRQVVVGDVAALVAWQTYARQVVTGELYTLAALSAVGQSYPRISELSLQAAFSTGVPDKSRARAWLLEFDGHKFYAMDMGAEGTWLFDFTTRQWTRFDTEGYEGLWNARLGVYWQAKRVNVVSDRINNYLYTIDPAQPLDEGWRPIDYVVTAGIAARNRMYHAQDSFRLIASAGILADPDGDATINFRFSDDNGNTWTTMESFTLRAGEYQQELAWRSLGSFNAPGRIFEVSSDGGLVSIDAASAEIDGLDNGQG